MKSINKRMAGFFFLSLLLFCGCGRQIANCEENLNSVITFWLSCPNEELLLLQEAAYPRESWLEPFDEEEQACIKQERAEFDLWLTQYIGRYFTDAAFRSFQTANSLLFGLHQLSFDTGVAVRVENCIYERRKNEINFTVLTACSPNENEPVTFRITGQAVFDETGKITKLNMDGVDDLYSHILSIYRKQRMSELDFTQRTPFPVTINTNDGKPVRYEAVWSLWQGIVFDEGDAQAKSPINEISQNAEIVIVFPDGLPDAAKLFTGHLQQPLDIDFSDGSAVFQPDLSGDAPTEYILVVQWENMQNECWYCFRLKAE